MIPITNTVLEIDWVGARPATCDGGWVAGQLGLGLRLRGARARPDAGAGAWTVACMSLSSDWEELGLRLWLVLGARAGAGKSSGWDELDRLGLEQVLGLVLMLGWCSGSPLRHGLAAEAWAGAAATTGDLH